MGGPSDHPHRRTFERVRDHLLRQGVRATVGGDARNACRYRTTATDGRVLMCAVGCLIPEDRYDPDVEALGIPALGQYLDPELGIDPRRDQQVLDLLCCLRMIHDRTLPYAWAELLEHIDRTFSPDGSWWPADGYGMIADPGTVTP